MSFLRKIYPIFFAIDLILLTQPIIPWQFKYVLGLIIFLFIIFFILENNNKFNAPYTLWIFAFFVFCSISCLWALSRHLSMWILVGEVFPIYLMTYSVYLYIKSERELYIILKLYMSFSFLVIVYTLVLVDFSNLEGSRLGSDGNAIGFNPNFVGLYLAISLYIGYILTYIKSNPTHISSLKYKLYALVSITVIFLSGSRSALLLMLIPLVVIYFRVNKNFIKSSIIVTAMLLTVFILIMNVPVLYSNIGFRMEELFSILSGNIDGSEDGSRLVLIVEGVDYFKESPIIGCGINNYRVLSDSRSFFYAGRDFYAHCNYVELIVDIGIIGFIIYYLSYFKLIRAIKFLDNTYKTYILAILSMLLFIDVAAVSYYEPVLQLLLCLGFCLIKINRYKLLNT